MVISLILGAIFFGQEHTTAGVISINGALFLLIANINNIMISVINVFCQEMPIFLREHFNGMYRQEIFLFIVPDFNDEYNQKQKVKSPLRGGRGGVSILNGLVH